MAVPSYRRNLSKMEFFNTALDIQKKINDFMLRDFGVKDKVFVKKSKEGEIIEKEVYEFPQWMINAFRHELRTICHNLIMNINAANSIFPIIEAEMVERRLYQDKAIVACEQLHQEIIEIWNTLPTSQGFITQLIGKIEKEEKLLKGWRKSVWNKYAKEKD